MNDLSIVKTGQESKELRLAVSAADVEAAFMAYKEIQITLDKLMPDQLMKIAKTTFRKKGYWRAIKKWAQLNLEIVSEEPLAQKVDLGGGLMFDDWGFRIKCRATAPNGLFEDGDGACMASEKIVFEKDWPTWEKSGKKGKVPVKRDKDGRPVIDKIGTADNATVHNVRAHAVTRAKNRAISDLVAFGEVSAEELPDSERKKYEDGQDDRQTRQRAAQQKADHQSRQQPAKKSWFVELWERAKAAGVSEQDWKELTNNAGFKNAGDALKATPDKQNEFTVSVQALMDELAGLFDAQEPPTNGNGVNHDYM
jgi:hypothetical protein